MRKKSNELLETEEKLEAIIEKIYSEYIIPAKEGEGTGKIMQLK